MTSASKIWMALATAGLVATGAGTAHAVPSYGDLAGPGATEPNVYYGTTPTNGDFTIDTANGIEVGLRVRNRPSNTLIDGSSGVYHVAPGTFSGGTRANWNYDFSVNTAGVTAVSGGAAGGAAADLTNFIVRVRVDTDPGLGTSFVTIGNAFTNWGDNEYVNGPAYVGPGAEAGERVDTGLGPLAGEDGFQQSANPLFPNSGFAGYDPNQAGLYEIELAVFAVGDTGFTTPLAITDIQVQVPEPASALLLGIGLAGLGFSARRRKVA